MNLVVIMYEREGKEGGGGRSAAAFEGLVRIVWYTRIVLCSLARVDGSLGGCTVGWRNWWFRKRMDDWIKLEK